MKHRFTAVAVIVFVLSFFAAACSSSSGGGQNSDAAKVQLTGTVQVQGASNQSGQ